VERSVVSAVPGMAFSVSPTGPRSSGALSATTTEGARFPSAPETRVGRATPFNRGAEREPGSCRSRPALAGRDQKTAVDDVGATGGPRSIRGRPETGSGGWSHRGADISVASLPLNGARATCSAPSWPGSGATMSQTGPKGSRPHLRSPVLTTDGFALQGPRGEVARIDGSSWAPLVARAAVTNECH